MVQSSTFEDNWMDLLGLSRKHVIWCLTFVVAYTWWAAKLNGACLSFSRWKSLEEDFMLGYLVILMNKFILRQSIKHMYAILGELEIS